MSIGEICNRETVFTTKGSSISQAAQLMREQHVGDLVVVEEKAGRRIPVGILTDRDLVIEILAKGVRRVPVVDADGALAGIVSADDLLDLLADELTALARLLSREQARERQKRT